MFFTDDVKGDYERIKALGAEFTMPPMDVTGSTITMLKDTCGNVIQLASIDKSGEEALATIMRDGAVVVGSGVYTRHLLDELRTRKD